MLVSLVFQQLLMTNLMRRGILLAFALAPYLSSSAQEGVVRYDHVYPVQYHYFVAFQESFNRSVGDEFDRPPEHRSVSRTLSFGASESLMYPTSLVKTEPGDRRVSDGMEHKDTTYIHFSDGTYTESRDFSGALYLVKGQWPVVSWYLGEEERLYMGYRVVKAIATVDSARIEAWYTPEIPIPAGPGLYGGLPGLVLLVSNFSSGEVYAADSIALGSLPFITAPTRGVEVSEERYGRLTAAEIAEDKRFWGKQIRDLQEGRTTASKSDLSLSEILRRINQ